MGDHVLFFYGTLMAPQVLHRVIHGSQNPEPWQKALISIKPAILHGYRRHRVRWADYPAIVPVRGQQRQQQSQRGEQQQQQGEHQRQQGQEQDQEQETAADSHVLGTLVSGLTDGDVYRLDIFEGSEYVKMPVRVRVLGEGGGLQGSESVSGSNNVKSNPEGRLVNVLEAAGAEVADEGEEVVATTYVWNDKLEGLEAGEWDFESFKRDKMKLWVSGEVS